MATVIIALSYVFRVTSSAMVAKLQRCFQKNRAWFVRVSSIMSHPSNAGLVFIQDLNCVIAISYTTAVNIAMNKIDI